MKVDVIRTERTKPRFELQFEDGCTATITDESCGDFKTQITCHLYNARGQSLASSFESTMDEDEDLVVSNFSWEHIPYVFAIKEELGYSPWHFLPERIGRKLSLAKII